MIVRRYVEADFAQIAMWAEEWGFKYQKDQFPITGFIIDGIAAYFLYSTDSSVCWLENMIARKSLDLETRNLALSMLVDVILNEAKDQGYKVAYATTGLVSVAKRAKENGANVQIQQFLITKDLTQPAQLQ